MKISFALTVCNEFVEIQRLLSFLLENKRPKDEIVVLYDKGHGDSKIEEFLRAKSINGEFNWHYYIFDGDFSKMKNKLTSLCSGDWIFNIDADEMVSTYILDALPEILQHNDIDAIQVPRINTVSNLTQQHIDKWGWRVNDKGWVNFPDYQWRIYKNSPDIKWINKVHERLEGFKTYTALPSDPVFALFHPKTIERQERQNEFYETI